jgi:hypothetical protein
MFEFTRAGAVSVMLCVALLAGCGGGGNLQSIPSAKTAGSPTTVSADPGVQSVVDWNVIALQTTAAAAFNPPLESRNMAIVQGAVYDAVIAITGGYRPYLFVLPAARGASAPAAVATAAHDTLVGLYPSQQSALDAAYANYVSQIAPGLSVQVGVGVGRDAAARMLAARSADGSSSIVTYTPGTEPGQWQPAPPLFKPALDPGWGKVTPFLLRTGDQFRPVAPPALTSATYTTDFNEIKSIGDATSTTRTADETATAQFWVSTGPQLWNQAAQQLVLKKQFTIVQAAHAFAALNLISADSFIAAWDAKFTFNQWRPMMAIRAAASDGNPDTIADPFWTPLLPTPPFPDYPAAHAVNAGASEIVLTDIFGLAPGTFHITSGASGATHQYSSFQAVADETVNARVWGGIHWRTSCTVGRTMGQAIAAFDLMHGLQPESP